MDCDVIVVGSGPSGSAATYFLASQGFSVICIERLEDERFSRYHSFCGECISDVGARIINLQESEIRNRINTFRIDWPGGVRTDCRVKGYIIDRVALLNRLRSDSLSLGVRFVNSVVADVSETEDVCRVSLVDGTTLNSRFVIGADGAYSTTRRSVFGTEPEFRIPVEMRICDTPGDYGIITFKLKGQGKFYEWFFPSGPGSSVGAINHCLDGGEGLHGARAIPIGWLDQFVKGHVLLIGDAAGFVNPVSFGGLRIAFDTALHAAKSIATGDLQSYVKWWKSSPLSDRRFNRVKDEFASYTDEQYIQFSKHLGHGLYPSGFISVITHPTKAWLYVGCLMAIRNGW